MTPSLETAAANPQRGDLERQLERILADPLFQSSQRLSRFLRFVAENTLAGRAEELKEYVIGVEVFGLGAEYNPQENPVVRIMAGRLRSRLAEYYLHNGSSDAVFIDIPKGRYAPRFAVRTATTIPAAAPTLPKSLAGGVCVGREHELERLRSSFGALAGGGAIWKVSGDAGLGKTALAEDFLAQIQGEFPDIWVGRGSCSERLAEADAYVPIFEALHSLLGGAGSKAEQVMKTTAPTWYAHLTPAGREQGAPASDARPASHERMRREMTDLLDAMSKTAPVVLFLDDLHWSDASTSDLLAYLAARVRAMRVFVLMTYRPTALQTRGNSFLRLKLELERRGTVEDLRLSFLGAGDIERYIARQFPVNTLPPEFARVVYERTEGNPLFLTQLLRFLQERGVLLEREGAWTLERPVEEMRKLIPTGASSLIRLKLDALAEEDVHLLTCASVQGVLFDSAVIARALGRPAAEVEERLQELEAAHNFVQLVEEQEFENHTLSVRYRFVHVFYQNALFASLTPSRRAEYANAVAQALVAVTGGTSRAVAADVALLFEAGQDYAGATKYFYHASRNAARIFAYPETVSLCERGLLALSRVPYSRERSVQELGLLLILGLALMATRGYAAEEVERVHRRSLALCLELNEKRRLMPVLWGLHTCEVNTGNLEPSLQLAHQMRELAESSGDAIATIQSLHALGTTLAFMGRLTEARVALERIFEIQPIGTESPHSSLYLLDPTVTSLSMLARLLAFLGLIDQAVEKAASSVEYANRLAHPQSIAYATFWVGWVDHARGEFDRCRGHLETAMALSSDHGLALVLEWGRVVRGSALARTGRADEGIAEMRKSLAKQKAMRSSLEQSYCLTLLAEALGGQGVYAEALMLCEQALEFGARTGGRCYEAETRRVRGELILAQSGAGGAASAAEEFESALGFARERECRLLELRTAISYFHVQEKQCDHARGRNVLKEAAGWFHEGADCPILVEARRLLSLPVVS